jgi:hypothetical protein
MGWEQHPGGITSQQNPKALGALQLLGIFPFSFFPSLISMYEFLGC